MARFGGGVGVLTGGVVEREGNTHGESVGGVVCRD